MSWMEWAHKIMDNASLSQHVHEIVHTNYITTHTPMISLTDNNKKM